MGIDESVWIAEFKTVGRPSTKTARSMLFQNISAVRQSLGSTAFALLPWLAYADRRLSPPGTDGREEGGGGCEVKSVAHPIVRTAYGGARRARRNTNTNPIRWWDGTPLDGM